MKYFSIYTAVHGSLNSFLGIKSFETSFMGRLFYGHIGNRIKVINELIITLLKLCIIYHFIIALT